MNVGICTFTNVHHVHGNVHDIRACTRLNDEFPAPRTLIGALPINPEIAARDTEHAVTQASERLAKPCALGTVTT